MGYQSRESLGRRLVEGEQQVSIHGEKVAVRAQIHTLGGFSAHAGQTDLLHWFSTVAPSKPRVVLTHGEDGPRQALARKLKEQYRIHAALPGMNDTLDV